MDQLEHSRYRPGHFNGGLLLDDHKIEPANLSIQAAAIPQRFVLPLNQHLGDPAHPCVAIGDKVLRGQPLTRTTALVSAELHAPSSGRVVAIEACPTPRLDGLSAPCLIIESDGKDQPYSGFAPMASYAQLPPRVILERVREAGIVGLGGAVFPAHIKLNLPPGFDCEVLILNGCECEPYISCDMSLICERAGEIIQGAQVMMYTLGVTRCMIAIENDKTDAVEIMTAAIKAEGDDRIELTPVDPIYPTGCEKQLIKVLLDREVPSHGLPPDIGCLCQNIGTAFAVKQAVFDARPLISRVVTVTGPGVKEPRNLEVRLGTPIGELIEQCGGYTEDAGRLLMGGPMMGMALASDQLPVVKASNCILALTRDELRATDDEMPCIRCGQCADSCPANLLPQQLHWYSRNDDLPQLIEHSLLDCIECGCCDLVCPSHIPLTQSFRDAKALIWNHERARDAASHTRRRFLDREARLAAENTATTK